MMYFRDFPMILGESGKYEIHPPKLCASLRKWEGTGSRVLHRESSVEDAVARSGPYRFASSPEFLRRDR